MAKTEKNTEVNKVVPQEVQVVAEENYKDLSGKTLKELLTIKDALTYLRAS